MSAETSFKNGKAHKSVKFETARRKKSKDRVETLDSKAKGFQRNLKAQRGTSNDSIETFDSETKGFRRNVKTQKGTLKIAGVSLFGDKGENIGKRGRKLKGKDGQIDRGQGGGEAMIQGNENSKPVNFDRKRKRIYADQNMVEERSFGSKLATKNRKALHSLGQELKVESTEEKGVKKGKTRGFDEFNGSSSLARARKDNINDLVNKKSGKIFRGKVKNEDSEIHSDGNGVLKKRAERKSGFTKQSVQNQVKHIAESSKKAAEKKIKGKKSMVDNLEMTDDRPKKKKRVIRIDPHDISNKRLDDGIIVDENSTRKQEDLEENKTAQLSMNAQFRAIKPSPSILSFVEDNLLGRRRDIELRRAGYNTELSAPLDNIPFSTSEERERIEETLFRNKLTFFAAAKISSSFPPPDLPEIAFAGRSNVGKSSLLNSLTRQWGVVRTSDKPGLTQTINFFKLGTKLSLVDLPGYGFAYAKEEVKEAWEELVKEYVSTRVGLKRVCLLVDTKWGMKPRDHELIDLMERSQTKYQIVLTKTDLVFPIDVARRAMQIEETLKAKKSVVHPAMMVSSKSGAGIRSLRTALAKIARVARV